VIAKCIASKSGQSFSPANDAKSWGSVQEGADLLTKSLAVSKSLAVYYVTKLHRDAVIELAETYASFVGGQR
jgi:hypothetical protein